MAKLDAEKDTFNADDARKLVGEALEQDRINLEKFRQKIPDLWVSKIKPEIIKAAKNKQTQCQIYDVLDGIDIETVPVNRCGSEICLFIQNRKFDVNCSVDDRRASIPLIRIDWR